MQSQVATAAAPRPSLQVHRRLQLPKPLGKTCEVAVVLPRRRLDPNTAAHRPNAAVRLHQRRQQRVAGPLREQHQAIRHVQRGQRLEPCSTLLEVPHVQPRPVIALSAVQHSPRLVAHLSVLLTLRGHAQWTKQR